MKVNATIKVSTQSAIFLSGQNRDPSVKLTAICFDLGPRRDITKQPSLRTNINPPLLEEVLSLGNVLKTYKHIMEPQEINHTNKL